ncbi:MAG: transglutaminase family protein [Cyanobacteriota bacterium]|nr:transglutaminase family protein [Cyanobacteriota bacterium]
MLYEFEFEWFAPFFEFRFPIVGEMMRNSLQLELRYAIELWHVLRTGKNLGNEITSAEYWMNYFGVLSRESSSQFVGCLRPALLRWQTGQEKTEFIVVFTKVDYKTSASCL